MRVLARAHTFCREVNSSETFYGLHIQTLVSVVCFFFFFIKRKSTSPDPPSGFDYSSCFLTFASLLLPGKPPGVPPRTALTHWPSMLEEFDFSGMFSMDVRSSSLCCHSPSSPWTSAGCWFTAFHYLSDSACLEQVDYYPFCGLMATPLYALRLGEWVQPW